MEEELRTQKSEFIQVVPTRKGLNQDCNASCLSPEPLCIPGDVCRTTAWAQEGPMITSLRTAFVGPQRALWLPLCPIHPSLIRKTFTHLYSSP